MPRSCNVVVLLSGTGDSLYADGKWVTGSSGLTSTLGFIIGVAITWQTLRGAIAWSARGPRPCPR